MPPDSNAAFDQAVLDLIEHSPVGAVPATPSYQDALGRLHASHQVYASADHKGGYVTVRALTRLPVFHANNLEAFVAHQIDTPALESNQEIFSRYVRALPLAVQARAEEQRTRAAGKPAHHRPKHVGDTRVVAHDPVHSLVLVPGTGPHPGLPGNYLYGSLLQHSMEPHCFWSVHLHDGDDGAAFCDQPDLPAAYAKLLEVLMSAPFELRELASLGFRLN